MQIVLPGPPLTSQWSTLINSDIVWFAVSGTLLTIGSLLVTGLFVVVTCVAFPVVLFLGVAYVGASFAMGLFARLFATTSSSFKGIAEVRRR